MYDIYIRIYLNMFGIYSNISGYISNAPTSGSPRRGCNKKTVPEQCQPTYSHDTPDSAQPAAVTAPRQDPACWFFPWTGPAQRPRPPPHRQEHPAPPVRASRDFEAAFWWPFHFAGCPSTEERSNGGQCCLPWDFWVFMDSVVILEVYYSYSPGTQVHS